MKRAFVFSVLLSACASDYLESGRYACERGQPDQCPGQWRCGLEGYCHQLGNTSVAWRCESDDDCESGFRCGLTRTREFRECHDPAAPQDWPCEQENDCVGGWSCGLAASGEGRQCHDPSAPRDWPCEVAGDCLGGWTCGVAASRDGRQCHDPSSPRSWPCDTSADCVGGWSCGLAFGGELHECHDPANPRAWTCFEDTDCLGGWRCGTERVCVDPSADALGQLTLAALDGGVHLNSLGLKAPITQLTISPLYTEGRGRSWGDLAYVQEGHLRAMTLDRISGAVTPFDLGTELPTTMLAQGARGTSYYNVDDEVPRLAALWPDGGLSVFAFDGGTVDRYDLWDEIFEPVDLIGQGTAAGELTPSTLVINRIPGDYYWRVRGAYTSFDAIPDELWTETPSTPFSQVPGNRINSIASLRHSFIEECVYLTDERGLWVSQRGGTLGSETISEFNFEPVSLDPYGHGACTGTTGPQIRTVTTMGDRWLAVTASVDGGATQVGVIDAARTWIDVGPGDFEYFCTTTDFRACSSDDRIRVDLSFGPCGACPAGSTFKGMSTIFIAANAPPALEVACGQPGAPDVVYRLSKSAGSTQCARSLITGESSYFSAQATPAIHAGAGVVAWSGPAGQLWFGPESVSITDIAFDRAAAGVVRTGPGANQFIAFTPQLLGTPSSIGLTSTPSTQLTAPVAHAPTLAMSGGLLLDLDGATAVSGGRTVAFMATNNFNPPVTAVLTRSALGSRIAVVSTGTLISAGDVDAALAGTGTALTLAQRLSTVEPITSLSFPREHTRATSGPLLVGYAVIGSNVARVVAETLTRWRTELVSLPPTLQPIETWFQGTKGRVGFHDGSVFSLPSRVRISEALPGGEVMDFAQTCGQQLALTRSGLYRLESDAAGPVGHWMPLSLPPEIATLDFTDGRVHGVGNDVFVFTRMGEAARITFASCPE